MSKTITIEQTVSSSPDRVFKAFIEPDDLMQWHHASDGWTTPHASTDPVPGGKFTIGFQDPNGKYSFDYTGTYSIVDPPHMLAYALDDNRQVSVEFVDLQDGTTKVIQMFEMESENTEELQREGWSAQLRNLAIYLEGLSR